MSTLTPTAVHALSPLAGADARAVPPARTPVRQHQPPYQSQWAGSLKDHPNARSRPQPDRLNIAAASRHMSYRSAAATPISASASGSASASPCLSSAASASASSLSNPFSLHPSASTPVLGASPSPSPSAMSLSSAYATAPSSPLPSASPSPSTPFRPRAGPGPVPVGAPRSAANSRRGRVAAPTQPAPLAMSNAPPIIDPIEDLPRTSSTQSAATTHSSIMTPRSSGSVITKTSSVSEPLPSTGHSEDEGDPEGGMSVDDAISMYLHGFHDDPPEPIVEEPDDSYLFADPGPPRQNLRPDPPPDPPDPPPADVVYDDSDTAVPSRQPSPVQPPGTPPPTHASPPPQSPSQVVISLPTPSPPSKPITLPSDPPSLSLPEPDPLALRQRSSSKPAVQINLPSSYPETPPPRLGPMTATRDRYGFLKDSSHISVQQYDICSSSYDAYLDQRQKKWHDLLFQSGISPTDPVTFPQRSAKMKRYIRQGIPPEYRGTAWFYYAGGYEHYHTNPGLYRKLVEKAAESPSNDDKEHIERDLHRTFPDNIHFKPDNASDSSHEPQIIQSLRRVLYAFSIHNPKIGYTQSLNFIAGLLLLFLSEEKAFWMLHIITSDYLPATHEVSLEGANVDMWILMVLLREALPTIYTKVVGNTSTNSKTKPPPMTPHTHLPDITLGLTGWLMSLFVGSLPVEPLLRVWDVFFYEGSRTFFRVALALFRASEPAVLAMHDPVEIFMLVQAVPRRIIDPNALMGLCFSPSRRHRSRYQRPRLAQARVEHLREVRRKAVREDNAHVWSMARKATVPVGNGSGRERSRDRERDSEGAEGMNGRKAIPTAWRAIRNYTR